MAKERKANNKQQLKDDIAEAFKDLEYDVVNPRNLYLGKSYSDWATDWFNWNLSAYADKRNSGPVVFLRAHGLPNIKTGAYLPDEPTEITARRTDTLPEGHGTASDYPWNYVNDPNIRVCNDRLQIFEDQAVFFPIITAYQFASVPYRDWGYLQDYTGSIIDNGDNPPERNQLSINNNDFNLPRGLEMNEFRI